MGLFPFRNGAKFYQWGLQIALGLTCYLKWPCLERFLVENENPGETSGFLFYHNELAQSFGEQVEQLVRDHPSVKGDLGKCILKKKIIYLQNS